MNVQIMERIFVISDYFLFHFRGQFQALQLPEALPAQASDVIAGLNEYLIHILTELSLKDDTAKAQQEELKVLSRKL